MGSFLTRTYLIDYPQGLSGAILSGTGQQSPIIINAGLALIKAESRKDGMRKRSDKVDAICFGAYNRKFKPNRTNRLVESG